MRLVVIASTSPTTRLAFDTDISGDAHWRTCHSLFLHRVASGQAENRRVALNYVRFMNVLYGFPNLPYGQNWASDLSMRTSIELLFDCWKLILLFHGILLGLFVHLEPDCLCLDHISHYSSTDHNFPHWWHLYIYIQAWLLIQGIQFSKGHWKDRSILIKCESEVFRNDIDTDTCAIYHFERHAERWGTNTSSNAAPVAAPLCSSNLGVVAIAVYLTKGGQQWTWAVSFKLQADLDTSDMSL